MEVSHASSETQSAAIGINGKAEEVTVSTDAEFMMTIAHGIYSNKALALVRELLCNARDGHSKAGKLDAHIDITLTDNSLVVRDYGTGIPNEIFARTYMTFGKSTKRQEKGATGGFGVGTKVPWAVCDVFSGRNFINGSMTAYSIVKSDPSMEGKPTCTPVMSIPSTEPAGVEVTVPFPEKMHREIHSYILYFVDELGIPAKLNGQILSFSKEFNSKELKEVGYTRLTRHPRTVIQNSQFYVRQGDVIYPIEEQDEFADAFKMMSLLNGGNGTPILFQAEPDSIIPTLSRESLQYTDRTSKSIRDLMKKALQVLADNIDQYAQNVKDFFPSYIKERPDFIIGTWRQEFDILRQLPNAHAQMSIANLSQTQNYMLMKNMERWLKGSTPYIESRNIVAKDYRYKLFETIENFFKEKLKTYTYLNYEHMLMIWQNNNRGPTRLANNKHDYYTIRKRHNYEEYMRWDAERLFNPEIVDVYYAKRQDYINVSERTLTGYYIFDGSEVSEALRKNKEEAFNSYNDWMSETVFVSKTVVISGTPQQMIQRALEKYRSSSDYQNIFASDLGRLAGARFIKVRAVTKPDAITQMKKLYESWGYDVIVLMDPTKAEIAARNAAALERAKLKEIPLPYLHEMILERSKATYHSKVTSQHRKHLMHLFTNPDYIGKPLYFVMPRGKELPYALKSPEDYVRLIKFVGTDIICVSTKAEIVKVVKEGRVPIDEQILEFAQWFYRQPGIHEKLYYKGTFFAKRAAQNKYLTKLLFNRIPPKLTAKEELILDSLRVLTSIFPKLGAFIAARDRYFNVCCTPSAHYQQTFQRYANTNFCDVSRALEVAYARKPSRQRAIARSILKNILKERPA